MARAHRALAVKTLCTVNFGAKCHKLWLEPSFKSPLNKAKHRNAVFQLSIKLGNATLDFMVTYKNDVLALIEAEYAEQF